MCVDLLWRRRYRDAAAFTVVAVVAAVAWTSWSTGHVGAISDYNDVFKSTYSAQLAYELPLADVPGQIRHHSDAILIEIGRIFVPDVFGGAGLDWLRRAFAVMGLAALAKVPRPYVVFSAIYLTLLLIWPWRPFPRLFLPLLPFLVGGVSIILSDAARRWRISVPPAALASLFWMALLVQAFLQFSIIRLHRNLDRDLIPAYAWIIAHTPQYATFTAYRDATLFLHTGRQAESIHTSVRDTRHTPDAGLQRVLHMVSWARARGHRYILLAPHDYVLSPDRERELRQHLVADPSVIEVHREGGVSVYELR